MKLKSISITGFKGYRDTVRYEFGEKRTIIRGRNWQGKTSIAEAISFCVTGKDFYGRGNKGKELINGKVMDLELVIEAQGSEHKIRRYRDKKGQVLFLDEKETDQKTIDQLIGSPTIFSMVLNPTNITDSAPKDLRGFIVYMMPEHKEYEEILGRMDDVFVKMLLDNGFKGTPEIFRRKLQTDLKERKESVIYCDGVIAGKQPVDIPALTVKWTEADTKRFTELKEKRSDLANRMREAEQKKQIVHWGQERLEKEIKDLERALAAPLKVLMTCPHCGKDILEADEHKAEIKSGLEARKKELELLTTADIDKEIESVTAAMASIKEAGSALSLRHAEYQQERSRIESVKSANEQIRRERAKAIKDRENDEKEVVKIGCLLDALKEYDSVRMNIYKEIFSKYLDKVELELFQLVKSTGEMKPAINITYDGKDFNKLSGAERIRAGLELAGMVLGVTGTEYPVVIDNAESILEIPFDGQLIELRVADIDGIETTIGEDLPAADLAHDNRAGAMPCFDFEEGEW